MTRTRVLVADDSPTLRRHLCEVLGSDPDITVVAEAENGRRAIELCGALRPDVVTLDMMMPVMTGLEATEHIMAHCPTPILIVSASTNRDELTRTYDALAAGAVDVLDKPGLDDDTWAARLCRAVKLVARVRVITHPRARLRSVRGVAAPVPSARTAVPRSPARDIVALGASTGGPAAIVALLRAIPAPSPAVIVLVLHIGEPFGRLLAEWLDGQSEHRVALARHGQDLATATGKVLMAPPGAHLCVERGRARLSDGPERHSCRPSVDVLFESLAAADGGRTIACLLTGMGRDGATGLLALRHAGALTIAQDEATSVVYGMPREAVLLGAAQRVLPLPEIGPAIASATGMEGAP